MISQISTGPLVLFNSNKAIRNLMTYAIIFFSFNCFDAQSLVEELGGVNTDFKIISDSVEMDVLSQAIVWRGIRKMDTHRSQWVDSDYEAAHSSAYGYGYGLRALHLEFLTTSTISKEKRIDRIGLDYLELKLFDKDQKLLLKTRMTLKSLKRTSNLADLTSYSLSLIDIPVIILDRAESINILLVEAEEKRDKKKKKK